MDAKRIAKRLAEESIVLLKNQTLPRNAGQLIDEDHVLPFSNERKAAFFGRSQIDTIYSGNGSGAAHGGRGKNILEECERAGICAEPGLKAYYQKRLSEEEKDEKDEFDWSRIGEAVNSGIMYEIFGRYHAPAEEYEIPKNRIEAALEFTDTAILALGRNSGGEECDRHLQGDYYLTGSEKALVEQVCCKFSKVILILNTNGLIDLSWTEGYKNIKSILFIGIPGEEGAAALADILVGNVNPSGKLPVTIARHYEDYPSAEHFSWNKEEPEKLLTYESYGLNAMENGSLGYAKSPVTVYQEGIFAGYRYFDTFGKEPLFPFGYGLSYSEFVWEPVQVQKESEGIRVEVLVRNTGCMAGKETIQMYLHVGDTGICHASQELKGFEKTKLLAPREEDRISMFLPFREFACYDERNAAYVIVQGIYELYIGNSSRNTCLAARVTVKEEIVVEQCRNCLGLQSCNVGKLSFQDAGRQAGSKEENCFCKWELILKKEDVLGGKSSTDQKLQKARFKESGGEISAQAVKNLSVEQLAALCVGYGPGTPFSAFGDGSDPETVFDRDGKPVTTNSHPAGANGYVSPAILEEGIHSVFYKDGPAGIGETVWPAEMLIACAFNRELWYQFGNAVGEECEGRQVDIWLAPAVNLHRNPMGGRNFEYFSEDPYLTGICACEITKGVQENHPVLVCPKHFAVNEQETYRRGSAKKNYDAVDSIIQERAAREIYLKPFEMLVRDADISCIMTSFNKINGVFSGGNRDLCTQILRREWGFTGIVVTDWGDMDVVVDGADAVAAGNDIVMPGGPPVIAQILKGMKDGRLTISNLKSSVENLLRMTGRVQKREQETDR